jgi:succinyl-CoA synthetase beta subunit
LKIHEYQAKEILGRFKVPTLRGRVASTVDEAVDAGRQLGGSAWVVKAQIHAGGRGKGGGVKLARGLDALRETAGRIIGMKLVTPQTGPAGQKVRKVLIEEACDLRGEYYVGIVLDRKLGLPVLMASSEGGVEIEEVAARSPEKIHRRAFDPVLGLRGFEGRILARKLGFGGDLISKAAALLTGLSRAFLDTDASLAEINPMVETADGRVIALDAKFAFDDNALYRHPEITACRDIAEEDPREARARELDLSYIKLDGSIGCMVNGAGLAMATLDIIKHYGGSPANFLDVGGGATAEKVTEAFKIILDDADVRGILVNIFGGIMKCDVIAQGIVTAARQVSLGVPLVVRLEGTNVDLGKRILKDSGLSITTVDGLAAAAEEAVRTARAGGR